MLEILITLAIVATALLGTAGMQLYAMRAGKNSELRTHAVFLASDLAERMEANKSVAISGAYEASSLAAVSGVVDCTSEACDAANQAQFDLWQWETEVSNVLTQPTWTVTADITDTPPSVTATYDIRIGWSDRDQAGIPFYYSLQRTLHHCPPAVAGCN